MELTIILMALFPKLDSKLCPLAPAPQQYEETVRLTQNKKTKRFDIPNSIQMAGRLVDTRHSGGSNGKTVGWIYWDERGLSYVVLVPFVDPSLYNAFRIPPEDRVVRRK